MDIDSPLQPPSVPEAFAIEQPEEIKPQDNMVDTALQTIKPKASGPTFDSFFLTSRSKLLQLNHDTFAELRKYLLLRQNAELLDAPDLEAMHSELRKVTSRFEIFIDVLVVVERFLELRAVDRQPDEELFHDLDYLVGCVQHTEVEAISIEGAENLNNNLRKLESIFSTVLERLYEGVSNIKSGTEGDIRKYSDVLICLSKEITDILQGADVIKSKHLVNLGMTEYDAYRVKQTTATNTEANRTQSLVQTARKNLKEDHYRVESIHFDKELEPHAFDYVQPPLHQLYISEAAKAYAEVVAVKISKVVLEEELEEKPEILTQNYFSEQCENPMLHYFRPDSKEIVFYNLVDIFDALSITKEFQHVQEIKMSFQFSPQTRSIIAPSGKIFITNGRMKPGQDDNSFFEYGGDGTLKARQNMPVSKREHAMIHLNGFIYVVGGRTLTKKCTTSCHRYDIRKKIWSEIGNTSYAIRKASLSAMNSRYIFRFGGLNEFDYIDKNIEVYDSMNDGWTPVRTSSKFITQETEVLYGSFAVPINENTIYIFGGDNMNNFQTDSGYTFSVAEIKERKRKPSKVEGILRSLKETRRTIFSYAGRFVQGSALIHKGSIYFLREKYY